MAHYSADLLDVLFAYGLDVRARRVYLHGPLDVAGEERSDENGRRRADCVVRGLQYLDKTSGEIDLWICTPGGDVSDSFAIYDAIRLCRNRVRVVAFGEVCSAGILVLVAGDHRAAAENSWAMTHAPTSSIGDADHWTAEQRLAIERRQVRRWADLMGKRTKRKADWWLSLHRGEVRELWLSARQMRQYGVVDEVLVGEE